MRIISGTFKGKIIKYLKSSNTRPLKDSVKENIFNIIHHSNKIDVNIENSLVLDLYSGIGYFGLECISRKAKKVIFVENNVVAINILKKNISLLSSAKTAIVKGDKIENVLQKRIKNQFHILFLDPPFADNKYILNLHLIKKKKIYSKNHIVIIHREKNSKDKIDDLITTILIKNYGRSKVIFGKFS